MTHPTQEEIDAALSVANWKRPRRYGRFGLEKGNVENSLETLTAACRYEKARRELAERQYEELVSFNREFIYWDVYYKELHDRHAKERSEL
jgi:hypothetical protein